MHITLCPDAAVLGLKAAQETAQILREAIGRDGFARIILSTGASQFTTLDALVGQPGIDWQKVEMFHLDEYVGLSATHPASFRKYLKERFVDRTNVGSVHYVDGAPGCIGTLTRELDRAPVHVGLIGIGQNAHVAFNDPPVDFETRDAYIFVTLDDACKAQQVHEGWFPSVADVPKQAISMSVNRILRCQKIISAVPYAQKASAIRNTLQSELSNAIPGTVLKTHPHFSLYVDQDSFSQTTLTRIIPGRGETSFDMTVCC
ncbi:MAG: glucosamine-6-phosphate deaminase [Clostridiales bacterium]|nr:glucosamine-6-phosphate deaminase [Clostridiales bacterium]